MALVLVGTLVFCVWLSLMKELVVLFLLLLAIVMDSEDASVATSES